MKCPSCARDNPEGAKFCSECASALRQELACPSCGFPNAPGSRFCNECAQALAADAPLSRTPTPSPSPALPASFADGRYTVKGFLGEGGRKRVYLAHDTKLDRDVAVAVIKTDGLDEAGLSRVRRRPWAASAIIRTSLPYTISVTTARSRTSFRNTWAAATRTGCWTRRRTVVSQLSTRCKSPGRSCRGSPMPTDAASSTVISSRGTSGSPKTA